MHAATIAVAGALALTFGAGVANGQAFEPNDNLAQAQGPLAGGVTHRATIENQTDVDWYFFYSTGQRQIELQLINNNGTCGFGDVELFDPDGQRFFLSGVFASGVASTARIAFTASFARTFYVRVDVQAGCDYGLRLEPSDAIGLTPPGLVAQLGPLQEIDDVQRIYVDDLLVGTAQGTTAQSFTLGRLPSTARIRVEAENTSGGWSWKYLIEEYTDRSRITRLTEEQRDTPGTPRIGLVRRVTISPSGNPLESCGETLAPAPCIPVDTDLDGVTSDMDCNDGDAAISPNRPERPDNAVDENCDGVLAYRTRLVLRQLGGRFVGRVVAPAACRGNRVVTLRRVGSGARVFARTRTTPAGGFVLKPARRPKGRVFGVAPATTPSGIRCLAGTSTRIRSRMA